VDYQAITTGVLRRYVFTCLGALVITLRRLLNHVIFIVDEAEHRLSHFYHVISKFQEPAVNRGDCGLCGLLLFFVS
jgi:hypothetical protein